MNRTLLFTMILAAAAAVNGFASSAPLAVSTDTGPVSIIGGSTTGIAANPDTLQSAIAGTPEPTSLILIGSAMMGLGLVRRRGVRE